MLSAFIANEIRRAFPQQKKPYSNFELKAIASRIARDPPLTILARRRSAIVRQTNLNISRRLHRPLAIKRHASLPVLGIKISQTISAGSKITPIECKRRGWRAPAWLLCEHVARNFLNSKRLGILTRNCLNV